MKQIIDEELEILIFKEKACYDWKKGRLGENLLSITSTRKNGFLMMNNKHEVLGIVYRSDDKRTMRYGMSEILFFKPFEKEYGVWRVIKINGQYLPFEKLESILTVQKVFNCTTDSRIRNVKEQI